MLPFNSPIFYLKQTEKKWHVYMYIHIQKALFHLLTQKQFSIGQYMACLNSKMYYIL